ncbi:TPR domain-containing protein [Brachyspira intermedia PWS/A]|uniref:TPR domain-containing protein n=1 Tax=Brachyspira intermedia (strain ATCC 51140 / PWS/A) TaxID=1045858 RepID=G0EJP7_BRAIP|nr:tetratricopeptide repeat protein [Brachyspira intermedia]AEM22443.1 TPR domain-containing protein [Brachyspira intermedia PWS/A]
MQNKNYTLEEIENIINKECSYEVDETDSTEADDKLDNNENIIDQVIEVLKEYIKKDKNNVKALTLLGRAYYSNRDNKKAEKQFRKALLINPNDDKALYYTAVNYLYNFRGNEKYNEALKLIKKAIELNANDSAYWHLLGYINRENKNYYAAIEYSEKAVKLNKSYVVDDGNYMEYYLTVIGESYFKLGKYDEAIKVFKEIIKLPRHDQSDFMYLGLSYFAKKEYDKAIENYEKVLEIHPSCDYIENTSAINALAKSYMALGEYQKGIDAYKEYIKKHEWRWIRYLYNKDIEDYKYLIEAFNQLIDEEPSNFEYYDGLETIYSYDLRISDKAANVLEKYLLNNTDNIKHQVYGTLAHLYEEIYRYDKAIEMCNKLMEINDFDSYYYSLLGHIYQEIKNYDKAIEMYEKYLNFECRSSGNVYCNMAKLLDLYEQVSEMDKRDLFINKALNYYIDNNKYINAAKLYLHIGEKYKAIEYYQKYINLLDDNKKYKYDFTSIAEIYESLGEKENAEEYYKKAIEIYENKKDKNYWDLESIGDLYNSIGNKNKAIEAYKKAIKLEIKSASCMFRRENIWERKEFKGYYSRKIGDLYMKIDNKNKALKCYKHAVSLEPNREEYYISIAKVYNDINEKDLSKEYYKKAIDIDKKYFETRPYRCDTLKEMAELYLKIDDKENAKECYKKILEINIYDDEAKECLEKLNI